MSEKNRFVLEEYNRTISDDELLADIRWVAGQVKNKKLTYQNYKELGSFSPTTVTNRFGKWNDVLEKVGMQISKKHSIPEEKLFQNLVYVWQSLGRQPRRADMNSEISDVSSSTYESRYGGWRKALEAFVEWANSADLFQSAASSSASTSGRKSRHINWRLRAKVLMRDGVCCQMCGVSPQEGARMHIDHIIPWSKGGESEMENLQVLCEACNIGKSDM